MKNVEKYDEDLTHIMDYCKESQLSEEQLFDELKCYIERMTATKVYTYEDIVDWLYTDMPALPEKEFNYLSILIYPFYDKVESIGITEQSNGKYLTIRFKKSAHKTDIKIPIFADEFSSFTPGTMYDLYSIATLKNVEDLKKGILY